MRRKKPGEEAGKVVVSIYVDEPFVKAVDELAEKLGVSRSQMFRNLAMAGYDDAKIMDAMGLFALARRVETFWKGKVFEQRLGQTT